MTAHHVAEGLYHVTYDDGDEEDLDEPEHADALALASACPAAPDSESCGIDENSDSDASVGGLPVPTPRKRKRQGAVEKKNSGARGAVACTLNADGTRHGQYLQTTWANTAPQDGKDSLDCHFSYLRRSRAHTHT